MRVSYQPNIFAVCSSRKELDFIFLILPGLQSVSKEKLEIDLYLTRTALFENFRLESSGFTTDKMFKITLIFPLKNCHYLSEHF